jgi:hypothetical protein
MLSLQAKRGYSVKVEFLDQGVVNIPPDSVGAPLKAESCPVCRKIIGASAVGKIYCLIL